MKNDIQKALEFLGPVNASVLATYLTENCQISPEAARKRLSRATDPVKTFPIPLLPKNENFFYLQPQRTNAIFWPNFHAALRNTESIFGIAIDGLIARGGIIAANEFPTVSGAPFALKKQVTHDVIIERLKRADIISVHDEEPDFYKITQYDICFPISIQEYWHRDRLELILLDSIRTWARNLGLASYNTIAIRGEQHPRKVGPFQWDLTGPSYLWPFRKPEGGTKAFLVVDAFCGELDKYSIRFFLRKLQTLQNSVPGIQLFPILVAARFEEEALYEGKRLGAIFATHENLFGRNVAASIQNLLSTLTDISRGIEINPSRLDSLLNSLTVIEGSAGNLKGILFELIVYYLSSIGAHAEFAQKALDPSSNEKADIDVLHIEGKHKCTCIECKGIAYGSKVSLEDVKHWIQKIKVMKAWLKSIPNYINSEFFFEMWTTGIFADDALAYMAEKKAQMRKTNLDWKTGEEIFQLAKELKETAIADALNQHFRKHPYANR